MQSAADEIANELATSLWMSESPGTPRLALPLPLAPPLNLPLTLPLPLTRPPHQVGDRCEVNPGGKRGEVKFVGKIPAIAAGWFVGVQYDEPVGKNDGTCKGN
jgi:hypothetical protein